MATTPIICFVDDSDDYRYLIQFLFKKYLPDCSIQFFTGGKSFIAQLSKLQWLPSIILLDYHMPIMDGKTTLIYLKEQPTYNEIPVVMMSAHATDSEVNRFYELGAESFIDKMADFDSIKDTMVNLCANRLGLIQNQLHN